MLAHPRGEPQLRLAVRGCGIDVIDAKFEQNIEYLIDLFLLHPSQRGGAENHPRTLMAGFSKRNGPDHWSPPRLVNRDPGLRPWRKSLRNHLSRTSFRPANSESEESQTPVAGSKIVVRFESEQQPSGAKLLRLTI